MIRFRPFLTGASLVLLASCFEPGGGGSVHTPPTSIRRGVPTTLTLELSAVNAHGPMDKRMTRINCHYRLAGEASYKILPLSAKNVDQRHLIATTMLPAFPADAAGPVEYYMDFLFDGVLNARGSAEAPEARVPLE